MAEVIVSCTFKIDTETGKVEVDSFGKCAITPLPDCALKISFPEVAAEVAKHDPRTQWDKDHPGFRPGVS